MTRVFGYLGLLVAVAIVLVLMVKVGRSITTEAPNAKTGSQKAYDDLKKDGDMDDPKQEMRDALKGNL